MTNAGVIRRQIVMLALGIVLGGGAALLAGARLAERVAVDARQIDELSTLSDSAAHVQAAVTQARLVAEGRDRADEVVTAAIDEARASLASYAGLEGHLDPLPVALTGDGFATVAGDLLLSLETGEGAGAGATPESLDRAYRALVDETEARKRSARLSVTVAEGGGALWVAATAVVLLGIPIIVIALATRSVQRSPRSNPVSGTPLESKRPGRLATELEDRAHAVLDHARQLARLRPQDPTAYAALTGEARRLLMVTRSLLSLEQDEWGELILFPEPIALSSIVERIRTASHDLGIPIEAVDDDVVVLADPVRLHQCIDTLNAVLAGYGAKRIGMVAERHRGTGSLHIAGETCSVPSHVLGAMQPGAHRSTETGALSLATAGDLIEAMSGTLRYHDIDGTAVFSVALPLAAGRR